MKRSHLLFLTVTILSMVLLASCSSKPDVELTGAEVAVAQAKGAEAEHYAPEAYLEVIQLLDEAKAEIGVQSERFALTRDFEPAKQKLIRVKSMAESCLKATEESRERTRQETELALADAELALHAAQTALENAPKGKGTKADLEALQADLQAARSALDDAHRSIDAGRYYEAGPKVAAAKGQANSISSEIEQALAQRTRRKT